VVIKPSHFTSLLLAAIFISTVFGITMRDEPRKMIRYGLYCFFMFVGAAIVLSWVMYFMAR
jgi:hypothetical protein